MLSLTYLKATLIDMHNPESQTSAMKIPLPPCGSPGLLKVCGPDAKKFLQGQLTCDLETVSETQSLLGAHCNPQGRVLFLFRLFYRLGAYYLVLPREMAAPALLALKKYAVFFKLELSENISEKETALEQQVAAEWSYFDLAQGIPLVYPQSCGLFLPHDLNLHVLQGVSWDKGCYTGQEIIARMHYRGKLKNHLYQAQIQTTTVPQPGAEIYSKQEEDFKISGLIVDYRKLSYNLYQVLVSAHEKHNPSSLRLDPQQNEIWEWLS